MCGGLVELAFQRHAPGFDEVGVEAADGLFLRRGRYDDAGIREVQVVVEPEEVSVAACDGEGRGEVGFGGRAGCDAVDCVACGGVSDGVRVAYCDVEGGFGGLFEGLGGLAWRVGLR